MSNYFEKYKQGLSDEEKARFDRRAAERADETFMELRSEIVEETTAEQQAKLRNAYRAELDAARKDPMVNYALHKVKITRAYREKGLDV